MEKIANLDLPSFSDRMQAEVVAAIQAELTATIDDLANSVRHLALRAKLTESIVDAREAERSAEALRIAAWATEEVEPQLSVERVAVHENATNLVPMPGELPLDTCNSYSRENDTADDQGLKPSEKSALRENAIAASICELYDRLGGFIKS
jgi:hypothetical protein